MRGVFTTSPIWYGVGGFVGRIIRLLPISYMCMILLNINLFSWRLVMIMYLSLQVMMKCTLFRFTVSCWLDMAYRTFCDDVGSFLPMLRIQTFFLFIAGNAWFHYLLFYYWDIYDMLWCSYHCVVITMRVPLGGKLKVPSNISFLIKGRFDRSIFNVRRVELFVPTISSEPGDQHVPKLLFFSSNFQMNGIWVCLCVVHTISLWLYYFCTPWIILLVFCYLDF